MVRCFDDAEIIHVEGDVDPVRDLQIINDELRIKDIEFVEKNLDALKKLTGRGGQSLEMKKLKEEQSIVESVLSCLVDEKKDVRKKNWGNKEVRCDWGVFSLFFGFEHFVQHNPFMMIKSTCTRINPAHRTASPITTLTGRYEMTF